MNALTLDQLLEGARYHADLALTAYSNRDERSILVNAAISLEQISKALLFTMHPTFLAETNNGSFESLRQLAGFTKRNDKPLRTIGAKGALTRVRDLITINVPKEPLEELIAVRDGVLHAGLLDAKRTRELLSVYLRYANEIYDALEKRQAWGDNRWGDWEQLVVSLITQSRTEVEHEVARKVEAARAKYRAVMERVPESAYETVVSALQARSLLSYERDGDGYGLGYYTLEFIICPACSDPGALVGGMTEGEYDLSEDLGPMDRVEEHAELLSVYLRPTDLRCGVCELELTEVEELRAAEVPVRIEFETKVQLHLTRLSRDPSSAVALELSGTGSGQDDEQAAGESNELSARSTGSPDSAPAPDGP